MVIMKNGNLFDTNTKYIAHQINCCGKMGKGVALQVKTIYRNVYKKYVELCRKVSSPTELLGEIQLVPTNDGKVVINIFGQLLYKTNINVTMNNGPYTNYHALELALTKIYKIIKEENKTSDKPVELSIPYGMSCGLAGGDWRVVSSMLHSIFTDVNVYVYKL